MPIGCFLLNLSIFYNAMIVYFALGITLIIGLAAFIKRKAISRQIGLILFMLALGGGGNKKDDENKENNPSS